VLCKKKGGGRVAAYEMLIGTSAVASTSSAKGKTVQLKSVMQTGRNLGMQAAQDKNLMDSLPRLLMLYQAGKPVRE
jgi:twitching motility protein PilT